MVLGTILGTLGLVARSCVAMAEGIDDMCKNILLEEIPSPDARLKVAVFERDCGVTTVSSTQASVLDARTVLPNEAGNIFIAKTGQAPSGPGGGPVLRVHWVKPNRVVLSHHEGVAVLLANQASGFVTVNYQTFQ